MTQIDLVYFKGCPHVEQARANLREALAGTGRRWREWEQGAEGIPESYRTLPSPSVVVGGTVVGSGEGGTGRTCRVGGAPTVATIADALTASGSR